MKTIATLILLALCASVLCACNGDGANPFGPPDKSTQPVDCSTPGSCG
jgi:hypothetical protein